ncbi:MAG: heme exporter protein CcmB [Gammaproteobacteria bacterium]
MTNIITSALTAIMAREMKRFIRHRDELIQPLVFFLLVVTLVSLAVGPDESIFRRIAPPTAWVAVILSITLKLDALFEQDFVDGTLEQMSLSSIPLPALIATKLAAHWLAVALPQILSAIFFMFITGADPAVIIILGTSLALGTPALISIGAIASALTLGARSSGTLVALIAIPLYLPVLIFGAAAVTNAATATPTTAELYFLGGLSTMALTLCPFASAASIRARLAI